MSDELLPFYQRELTFIRKMGAEFAERHPKIAGRLRFTADSTTDPHVERLIQAFAYLNARIRHKLDDDFPEISEALLGVLYPHYQRPIPSMAIAQFVLDRAQGELLTGYSIPRESKLETETIEGEPCRFQTCYPVTLWPIEVRSARLSQPPFSAPATPFSAAAHSVLSVELGCVTPGVEFSQLILDSLRFFLSGQSHHIYQLHELLFNNVLGVAVAASPDDPKPRLLPPECIQPVGFERHESMLPYSPRSFLGYGLLTEYFAFPEKFLFVDVQGLDRRVLSNIGDRLCLFFYLDQNQRDLQQNISKQTFQLGCTPIVNLYRQRAEPIRLTHAQAEYRVVPDVRRQLAHEVYSIDRVTATSPDNEQVEYQPFFSFKSNAAQRNQQVYWHASRRTAELEGATDDRGTEVYLTLVDLNFTGSAPADWTIDVETTCLNRDYPRRLGSKPRLALAAGGPLSAIHCLVPPTPTLRPALRHGSIWKLISHLSLNHISLVDGSQGAAPLRELLKLYDFSDSPATQLMISGVLNVTSKRIVGRSGSGPPGFCRGLQVTAHFDEERFLGHGLYLFASVLERFFGMYASINSFSKFIATSNQRERAVHQWPPRAGEKTLL